MISPGPASQSAASGPGPVAAYSSMVSIATSSALPSTSICNVWRCLPTTGLATRTSYPCPCKLNENDRAGDASSSGLRVNRRLCSRAACLRRPHFDSFEPDSRARLGLGELWDIDARDSSDLWVPARSLAVGQQNYRLPVARYLYRTKNHRVGHDVIPLVYGADLRPLEPHALPVRTV